MMEGPLFFVDEGDQMELNMASVRYLMVDGDISDS